LSGSNLQNREFNKGGSVGNIEATYLYKQVHLEVDGGSSSLNEMKKKNEKNDFDRNPPHGFGRPDISKVHRHEDYFGPVEDEVEADHEEE
jgi:hypothetical protein